MKLKILPAARHEYDRAVDWYADHEPTRLARFVRAIDVALTAISTNPTRQIIVYGTIREYILPKHRYAIYYSLNVDEIEIVSIFHTSRDPAEWQRRVEGNVGE